MTTEPGPAPDDESNGDYAGPVLWLNWRARAQGQPARTESREEDRGAVSFRPSWEEHSLWSDTSFSLAGDGQHGPYTLLLGFATPDGNAKQALVVRARDHLATAPIEQIDEIDPNENITAYAGGDVGDQMASLLSLALGRRLRSAGVTRHGHDGDEVGQPMESTRRPPFLPPPARRPMLPQITQPALLDPADPLLRRYSELSAPNAVAVQRAAHQFADAVWWAEIDPRIAWIKLFGAVETAADAWDHETHVDKVAQLETRHPALAGKLRKRFPGALALVAEEIASSIGVERKMRDFLMAHLPDPPEVRPTYGHLDHRPEKIAKSLRVLYQHRSNELHRGIPFPPPLCHPPHTDDDGIAMETVFGLAMSSEGGYWPASSFPMPLNTFVHLAGGALRKWWLSLPATHR